MKSFWPIVALVVIAGCAWFLVSHYAKQSESGQTVPYRAPVACEACGKAYITMLGGTPAKCFYCSEEQVWRALQCPECLAIIPMSPSVRAESGAELCPKCGKSSLKEVSSDGLEEH